MNKDYEHLKLLSIGFYVYAGLTGLFSLLPFIHLSMGVAMLSGAFEAEKNPPPPFVGWFLIGVALIFIVMGFALTICNFLAGKYLKQQRNYTFCFVMAVISCMFAPLGTILGVFAIVVLLRDSVKPLFEKQNFSPVGNPSSWQ